MSLFVIIAKDAPETLALRLSLRQQHLERLQQLKMDKKLILAGPLPVNVENLNEGVYGSLMIVDFASQLEVEHWIAADPFVQAKVYDSIEIYPYMMAIAP